ncbi:MAG: MFS transporter [Eubacterium sp.]|nr:MFS transporter [Eubacterium sp.]
MKQTISKKKKFGYAFGIFTESLIYNMFYTYYLTFLNEIVGIKPKYSAIIIFISIAWDAVTDPLIGNYTDRPGVDKRRVMRISVLPLAVISVIAWTSIGAGFSSQVVKILIYTFLSMLIWIFYTLYSIPYYAIVAELTEDYDERTQIRSLSSLLNAFAVGLGNILPALVPTVAVLLGKRFQSNSYAVIAAIISIIAVLFGYICCNSLKGIYEPKKELPEAKYEKVTLGSTFRAFGDILKLKPTKWFLIFVFFYLVFSSMIQSNLTYMVIDCIGMDYDTGIAIVIITLVISMAAVVPIVEKVAEKKDRRFATILFLSIAFVGEIIIKVLGLDFTVGSFKIMCILSPATLGLAAGTFWTLFYSMGYDLVELNEFKTGERRESIITAFPQLVQKFGSAFGILMAGMLLSAYGYDSSNDIAGKESLFTVVTDSKIINGMENISTLFPAIFLLISIISVVIYPMTRNRFNALMVQLDKKRKGEEYSTEGIEKLL